MAENVFRGVVRSSDGWGRFFGHDGEVFIVVAGFFRLRHLFHHGRSARGSDSWRRPDSRSSTVPGQKRQVVNLLLAFGGRIATHGINAIVKHSNDSNTMFSFEEGL